MVVHARSSIRWRGALLALVVVAFAMRLAVSLPRERSTPRGYDYYLEMADNIVEGRGFQRAMPFGQGTRFAVRTPGYPLVLAGLEVLPGKRGLKVAAFGALCGALSVLFVALLATRLFGARAGGFAGLIACFWPYAVWHDGSLQDTSLYTLLFLAFALLTQRAAESTAAAHATQVLMALAGVVGAAAVLVRVALLPSVVALLVIAAFRAAASRRSLVLLVVGLGCLQAGLLPWQWRNARVVGSAVLTSDGGRSLWLGNNPQTFSVYPAQSIDRAEERAWTALPEETRARVRGLGSDEMAQDAWFRAQALDFMRAHPGAAIIGGLRKAWATYSPRFNPGGSRVKQLAHALSYTPIALLALAAIVRGCARRHARSRWPDMLPFVVIILALALQSAIFFGHSGYRACVDPFLIVLAASWLAVGDMIPVPTDRMKP